MRSPRSCERRPVKVFVALACIGFLAHSVGAQPISVARDAFLNDLNSVAGISRIGGSLLAADPAKLKWGDYCRASQSLARQGQFRLAIREAAKALYIGQASGSAGAPIIFASNDIATAYSYAGDHATANAWADKTLAAIASGFESWAREDAALIGANAHRIKALYASAEGRHAAAVEEMRAGVKDMSRVVGRGMFKAEMSIALASIYTRAGMYEQAASEVARVLVETEPQLMLSAHRAAGDLALARKDAATATAHYAKAMAGRANDPYQVTMLHLGLARAARLQNDNAKASDALSQALASMEELRSAFSSTEMRTALYGNLQGVFDEAVDFFYAQGDAQKAFDTSEASRARAMLDLQRRVGVPDATALSSAPSLQMANIQSRLAPDQLLVVYHQLPTHLLAWVVTRQGLRSHHSLPASSDQVRKDVARLRLAIAMDVGRDGRDALIAAQSLHQVLVTPLQLPPAVDLVFVPHKFLHLLPFQALHDGSKWSIEKNPVAAAMSASLLETSPHAATTVRLTALGNPDIGRAEWALPGAEAEVKAIATMYSDAGVYVQKEATKSRLLQAAPGAGVVHVAAHAVVDEIDPMYSTIKLASFGLPGSDMEAREFSALDLRQARLVSLSACNSGLGTVAEGDEFMGFKRALFAGGARSALVSLWSVDDDSTQSLMTVFHRLWKTESKIRAMQKAQVALLADPKHSSPYYWAAFVLVGDPG